uniref:SEC7 domain-containing protein n=2 Tax=Kalmanozyma brasiliensis (strain GHG001) TaxID=1365824 RepID=V5EPW9_KALBG
MPSAPKLERSNTSGSRFTEHMSVYSISHSQRPSADLSALAANEKLHPFPGLALASPVQSQDGFSHMTVAPALASPAPTGPPVPPKSGHSDNPDSPLAAAASKGDQEANGKQLGLFSSIRRKASTLRRTPSSAKEKDGSSFWARRAKREESPKLPTEATFISAPILTDATPGPAATATQPLATVDVSHLGASNELTQRERDHDATFEHRLPGRQWTDKAAAQADLQRNASISSMASGRNRTELYDVTADPDSSSSSSHYPENATRLLAPSTEAMIHRYSRMLSIAGPSQTVPGATPEDMRDPPRKLLASDPVFQVISATTIKDRYLFLFSDILVIAKPVAAPGAEIGQTLGKMKQAAVLPSLSWKFSVKNILELHRLKVSVTSNTRTSSAKTRAQNPVLWGFVSHFSKHPDAAVRALVAKTGLEPTPASIAQLLYQTPELDRHDLTQYLTHPSRREILKAYVSQHRHVGVSIESALRTLLLDLRFPTDLDAFEALLMHFAQSWTQHNASMIKPTFTAQIASDLVFAIMALNDALHTDSPAGPASETAPNFPRPATVDTPGLFSAPCPELSKADFVSVFRQHDPHEVLSDRTLSRIYLSIRSEPLVQALDRFEPRFAIRVKDGKLPTRLTYAQPAEPVTLVIPAPDPDLAIRLYAQDMTFEPPILTFAGSNEASFTMWTKTLGPKQVVFVRAGRNARFYGGTEVDVADTSDSPLPRSFNVTVERAFMKHSFTLSSPASWAGGSEERFMFSFESGDKAESWVQAIRGQVEACIKQKAMRGPVGRATEMASLQVLRDTLVATEEGGQQTGLTRAMTVGRGAVPASASLRAPAMLDRAASTSRHYYAPSGVGRHERELLIPPSTSSANTSNASAGETRSHTKGSASLSLYPPSTAVTRLGVANASGMARSNSARSASSPHSPLSPLPPMGGASAETASIGESSVSGGRTGAGDGDKTLQGTQIVSIARLNSLLVRVVAHHQAQQAQQQQI